MEVDTALAIQKRLALDRIATQNEAWVILSLLPEVLPRYTRITFVLGIGF